LLDSLLQEKNENELKETDKENLFCTGLTKNAAAGHTVNY